MLGKLIKHEWKAVAKILGILHLAVLAMSVVGRVLLNMGVNDDEGIAWFMLLMVYMFSVFAVSVGSQFFLAIRFYKNMYTDEGYLTFTLPVKPWQHIFGKWLIAVAWTIIDYVAIILSILILVMNKEMWTEMVPEFNGMVLSMQSDDIIGIVEIVIFVAVTLLSICSAPLLYYFSISIGQLFNRHKILASVITYFITVNVIQVISTVASSIYMIANMDEVLETSAMGFYSGMWVFVLIAEIIMFAGGWAVVQFIMTRKLNLE